MKLSQIVDKDVDQNEIESKYLWNFRYAITQRLDLIKNDIDFFAKSYQNISYYLPISDNKIFAVKLEGFIDEIRQFFILDEFFNIKIIKSFQVDPDCEYSLASAYMMDSIFIFDREFAFTNKIIRFHAKRYLISQDKWITLSNLFFYPYECIGFKKKIIIISECNEIIIYDTILDSYSQHTPFLLKSLRQTILKQSGKLYLIAKTLSSSNIYYCDDPLSEWTFVCEYDGIIFTMKWSLFEVYYPYAYYNNSIYYFKDPLYYQFSLETFKTSEVKFKRY